MTPISELPPLKGMKVRVHIPDTVLALPGSDDAPSISGKHHDNPRDNPPREPLYFANIPQQGAGVFFLNDEGVIKWMPVAQARFFRPGDPTDPNGYPKL